MSFVLLGWGLISGGCIVGIYVLLLRFYTQRFWDSQVLVSVYLLLLLSSLLFLTAAKTGHKLFMSPHIPSTLMMVWVFLTVTYVPVRITRSFVRHGVIHVFTPATLFLISIFLSLILTALFLLAFLTGSSISL